MSASGPKADIEARIVEWQLCARIPVARVVGFSPTSPTILHKKTMVYVDPLTRRMKCLCALDDKDFNICLLPVASGKHRNRLRLSTASFGILGSPEPLKAAIGPTPAPLSD